MALRHHGYVMYVGLHTERTGHQERYVCSLAASASMIAVRMISAV